LHCAAYNNHEDIVAYLLLHGARTDIPCNGETAREMAVSSRIRSMFDRFSLHSVVREQHRKMTHLEKENADLRRQLQELTKKNESDA
jgi:ankyrin repeat protein